MRLAINAHSSLSCHTIADQPNLVVASAELSVRVLHPQQKYDAALATLNKKLKANI